MTATTDIWLPGIHHTPSPNFDQRPDPGEVDLLVVHNISLPPGEFGGQQVEAFFQNRLDPDEHPYFEAIAGQQVSAHLFIRRSGEAQQFVALNQRAWHAGASCFEGQERCNDFSIGIELEGTDDIPYTDAQYRSLARLTREIRRIFPKITRQRITGHCDIAPERKTDPGPAFDWQRYMDSL